MKLFYTLSVEQICSSLQHDRSFEVSSIALHALTYGLLVSARISVIQASQFIGIVKSYWQSIIAHFEASASDASPIDVVAEQKIKISNNSNSNPESKDKDKEKGKEKNKPKKERTYWKAILWGLIASLVMASVQHYWTLPRFPDSQT